MFQLRSTDRGLGKLLVDLTDYLNSTRTYCYIGNVHSGTSLITADITTAKNVIQVKTVHFNSSTNYLMTSKKDRRCPRGKCHQSFDRI